MIRFEVNESDTQTTIGIAGRLEADALVELEAHRADARLPVVFDLSELRSADEASIRWLGAHVAKGDRVTGASPYIGLRLERELESRGHQANAEQEDERE